MLRSPLVGKFFNELIDIVDILKPKASGQVSGGQEGKSGLAFEAEHVMWFYYAATVALPKHAPARVPNVIPEMSQFQEFKFQAVALSLHEVKILADLIVARQSVFSDPQLHTILTFAKKVKESMDLALLEQTQEITYLLFIDEKLPSEMEASYTQRSQVGDSGQPLLIQKVKEAIKSLLFSLDSFAMFFESEDQSSLMQITEFVIKFSYLFENSRSYREEKIPLKILAQYLHSHLNQLPEDYKEQNFRKLYSEILSECQVREEQKRLITHKNTELLLICKQYAAIHSMEKHISDIKQEEKIQQSFTRTHKFLKFINEAEVPVCIQVLQGEDGESLYITPQTECSHMKLEYVGVFVMGNRRQQSLKPGKTHKGSVSGHVANIKEFPGEFCRHDCVRRSIELEDDPNDVSKAFLAYMQIVREALRCHPMYSGAKDEELDQLVEEVEKHLTRRMYREIFPMEPTAKDFCLHEAAGKLAWVQPEHLDIPLHNRNEAMWKYAIQALKDTDERMSPVEKLNCLVECITIIVNVLELCSSSDAGISSDDSLPIIIYIVIKAQPKWMYSNLNYINKFRDQSKMLAQSGFCFSQIQSAIQFIENVGPSCFTLPAEEYERYMKTG